MKTLNILRFSFDPPSQFFRILFSIHQACFLKTEDGQTCVKTSLLQENPTQNIWKFHHTVQTTDHDMSKSVNGHVWCGAGDCWLYRFI